MVDTLAAVASFYFTCDINLESRGMLNWVVWCVVLTCTCMLCGTESVEVNRTVLDATSSYVTRGPPPIGNCIP